MGRTAWVVVVSLVLRLASGQLPRPKACAPGTVPAATADLSYRWPRPNPALVAKVIVDFTYPTITYPLEAEFTGTTLALKTPPEFTGGFTLAPTAGVNFLPEQYVLTRIEVRNPGQISDATPQVLKHSLEVALVHRMVGGGYWANVIIPLEVSGVADYDPLAALVDGATMPTDVGQREPMILGGTGRPFDLNSMIGDSTFLNYWTSLPTNCAETTVHARQLMRSAAVNIGYGTFQNIAATLKHAPSFPPLQSPAVAWTLNSCNKGACTTTAGQDLTSTLNQAKQLQSTAVRELRERKMLMDIALDKLVNGTGGATPEENLKLAISARSDLDTASSELAHIQQYTSDLQAQYDQSNAATFDADAPSDRQVVVALQLRRPTTVPSSGLSATDVEPKSPAPFSSLLSAAAAKASSASQVKDCNALRMSPIDIDTSRVVDPAMISTELREPVGFSGVASPGGPNFRTEVVDGRIRMRPAESETLGSVGLASFEHEVSYIDIVAPGEHAINGEAGDVEVQLIHAPAGGVDSATVVIALQFKVGESHNSWFTALLRQRQLRGGDVDRGMALSRLHGFLKNGTSDQYYRYDGTLTSPPCTASHWYVLKEPGHISKQQLDTMHSMLFAGASSTTPRQRFRANLVAYGTTRLISKVSAPGVGPSSQTDRTGSRHKVQKRIKM